MSDQVKKGRKPDFHALQPTTNEKNPDKTYWHRIGAGWLLEKEGIKIQLDSLPLNGEIVLMPPKEENTGN